MVSKKFVYYSGFVLLMVFLVIAAGGFVRMSQSGMGCPDWPKCFGKWIPPLHANELPPDFEKYLKKQDIDHTFNAYHTWVEYINRLLGALLGLFLLIQLAWSLKFWRSKKIVTVLCFLNVVLTGFQGWLGKRVVDANLETVKITTHMIVAFLIAALALAVIFYAKSTIGVFNKKIKIALTIALVLLTVQIALGTQVREQIDAISKQLNYVFRNTWIENLDVLFYIHRSYSLLLTALVLYIVYACKKAGIALVSNTVAVICIVAEIGLGVIMNYGNMPAIAQPLHLLFAAMLFLAIFYSWLHFKLRN
jgi:heme a synthase